MIAFNVPVMASHLRLTSTGPVLNIHDSHYCASNGKSVVANQYWHSTKYL